MIELTKRQQHSSKLAMFIEDNRQRELGQVDTKMKELFACGAISFDLVSRRMTAGWGYETILSLVSFISNLDFVEPEEVIKYLKGSYQRKWQSLIVQLENELCGKVANG